MKELRAASVPVRLVGGLLGLAWCFEVVRTLGGLGLVWMVFDCAAGACLVEACRACSRRAGAGSAGRGAKRAATVHLTGRVPEPTDLALLSSRDP